MIVVGARRGKFRPDGSVKSTPPSNVPLVTLGVFILWFGWFGFNGGSMLVLKGSVDALTMSNVLVNTNLAAAAGCLAVLFAAKPIFGRVDLLAVLNGAIGGLVAITAGAEHRPIPLGGHHRRDRRPGVRDRLEAAGEMGD